MYMLKRAAVLLVVLACLPTGCAKSASWSPFPVRYKTDHFKAWKNPEPQQLRREIKVEGQFNPRRPIRVVVNRVLWLANPANKNGEGIRNESNHLTMWDLEEPTSEPPRKVNIVNQFGKQTLLIREGRLFLAPAQKKPHDRPKNLEHFLCYRVLRPGDPPRSPDGGPYHVKLVDQFDRDVHRVESTDVGRPAFFCVPVNKNGEGLRNKVDHLTIYEIKDDKYEGSVVWKDQFKQQEIRGTWISNFLLVPTLKRAVAPAELPGGEN